MYWLLCWSQNWRLEKVVPTLTETTACRGPGVVRMIRAVSSCVTSPIREKIKVSSNDSVAAQLRTLAGWLIKCCVRWWVTRGIFRLSASDIQHTNTFTHSVIHRIFAPFFSRRTSSSLSIQIQAENESSKILMNKSVSHKRVFLQFPSWQRNDVDAPNVGRASMAPHSHQAFLSLQVEQNNWLN